MPITPLLQRQLVDALVQNNVTAFKDLVNQDSELANAKSPDGVYMLIAAIGLGRTDIAHFLLNQENIDVNCTDAEGMTPLHYAAQLGTTKLMSSLLKHPMIQVNKVNHQHLGAFWYALEKNNFSCLELLVAYLKKNNPTPTTSTHPKPPSEVSAHLASLPTTLAENFTTTLLSTNKNLYGLKFSIENEPVLVNTMCGKLSLLQYNIHMGNEEIVEYLLTHPHLAVNKKTETGESGLHIAIAASSVKMVKMLLTREDIDVNIKRSDGCTPLIQAIQAGNTTLALLLLDDTRTNIDLTNNNEKTALYYAEQTKQLPIIEKILIKTIIASTEDAHNTAFKILVQFTRFYKKMYNKITQDSHSSPIAIKIYEAQENAQTLANENDYLNIIKNSNFKKIKELISKAKNTAESKELIIILLDFACQLKHNIVIKYFIDKIKSKTDKKLYIDAICILLCTYTFNKNDNIQQLLNYPEIDFNHPLEDLAPTFIEWFILQATSDSFYTITLEKILEIHGEKLSSHPDHMRILTRTFGRANTKLLKILLQTPYLEAQNNQVTSDNAMRFSKLGAAIINVLLADPYWEVTDDDIEHLRISHPQIYEKLPEHLAVKDKVRQMLVVFSATDRRTIVNTLKKNKIDMSAQVKNYINLSDILCANNIFTCLNNKVNLLELALKNEKNNENMRKTPLMRIVQSNNADMLTKYIYKYGISKEEARALFVSSKDASDEILKLLYNKILIDKKQIDVLFKETSNNGCLNASKWLIINNKIQLPIKSGKAVPTKMHLTPLYQAIKNNDGEKLAVNLHDLAQKNCHPTQKAKSSIQHNELDSALHVACFYNRAEVVKSLIAANYDVNALNYFAETPFFVACAEGHIETVHVLLDDSHINNFNIQDKMGRTPFYAACESGNQQLVHLLMHDPRINITVLPEKDCWGELSIFKQHPELFSQLLSVQSSSRPEAPFPHRIESTLSLFGK